MSETRTEWRVVGEYDDGEGAIEWPTRDAAERDADNARALGASSVRIEKRTVTTTEWEPVDE